MMRSALALATAALLAGCATLPSAPVPEQPISGTVYKALGTEPFWSLQLDGREMIFSEANTSLPVSEPQPRPIHGFAGDMYQGRRISLNIVRNTRCSDGMSDRIYPDKVQVRVDTRSFEGCGGEVLMPPSLERTSWSVVSINGRPPASPSTSFVRFDDGQLRARFGCNNLSTPVQQVGERLITGGLISTRMACPDMRDEVEGSQVLRLPSDLSWDREERLTISNSGGRIVLRRAI
jgi:heat shock protein HslJ